MKKFSIFGIGALYGLLMRLSFGGFGYLNKGINNAASGPMLASFVLLVPALIGIFTVYGAREKTPGLSYSLTAPWLPTLMFTLGTALLLIEGSICIAMALPIFLIMASVGGLLCWIVLRFSRPAAGTMYSLFALPFLVSAIEVNQPMTQSIQESKAALHISARPEAIWKLINNATAIQPAEMKGGLAYMIGVPYPIEAITQDTENGRVRKLRWDKNVAFDEPITEWEENRFIKWIYRFTPDSFPPGALDEHVLIGGKYFDLIDTSYRLNPEQDGTRLEIVVHYRVSTNFNWYALRWGRLMVDDSALAILNFYKQRAEHLQKAKPI